MTIPRTSAGDWAATSAGGWRLAPAFDLTFSDGPMGQHHMDVCGEGTAVQRRHLLQLAKDAGVAPKAAQSIIERRLEQASGFAHRVAAFPIRRETVRRMDATVAACRERLAS